MKNTLVFTLIVLLFANCSSDSTVDNGSSSSTMVPTEEVDSVWAVLNELDEKMMSASTDKAKTLAKDMFKTANDFANQYPSHEKTPQVLELAAKSSEVLGQYDAAVNILHKLITEFPETASTPRYMWNKARILEEKMGKIPNAKAAYEALIVRFPNEQIAKDAQSYIDNFLGKSQEDILLMLDSINTSAVH